MNPWPYSCGGWKEHTVPIREFFQIKGSICMALNRQQIDATRMDSSFCAIKSFLQ